MSPLVKGRWKHFSMGTAIGVGIQCLEALEDLHKAGYLHRDIKPGKMFVLRAASSSCWIAYFHFCCIVACSLLHSSLLKFRFSQFLRWSSRLEWRRASGKPFCFYGSPSSDFRTGLRHDEKVHQRGRPNATTTELHRLQRHAQIRRIGDTQRPRTLPKR